MHRTGQIFLLAGVWLGLGLLFYVYFQQREAPPPRIDSPHSIELRRGAGGHFHIDGQINAVPVRFLIDTGASVVAIPEHLAQQAGLVCTRATLLGTANGQVEGCTTRAARLAFGPFTLHDISLVVLPNLSGDALLGMNVLRHVRIEQNGDNLRLSRLP